MNLCMVDYAISHDFSLYDLKSTIISFLGMNKESDFSINNITNDSHCDTNDIENSLKFK